MPGHDGTAAYRADIAIEGAVADGQVAAFVVDAAALPARRPVAVEGTLAHGDMALVAIDAAAVVIDSLAIIILDDLAGFVVIEQAVVDRHRGSVGIDTAAARAGIVGPEAAAADRERSARAKVDGTAVAAGFTPVLHSQLVDAQPPGTNDREDALGLIAVDGEVIAIYLHRRCDGRQAARQDYLAGACASGSDGDAILAAAGWAAARGAVCIRGADGIWQAAASVYRDGCAGLLCLHGAESADKKPAKQQHQAVGAHFPEGGDF